MQTCRGIHATRHGTLLLSTVVKNTRGWKCVSFTEWQPQSSLRNFMLLHHQVTLSLTSRWTRTLPQDLPEMVIHEVPGCFFAATSKTELEYLSSLLTNNISGIYPDDMLLVTLPRAFAKNVPSSYISIFNDDDIIHVGVIINGAITAVFSAAAIDSASSLDGFLGRIERYSKSTVASPGAYPAQVYQINSMPFSIDHSRYTTIDCGSDNPDELKAAGCALCFTTENAYAFSPPAPAKKRSILQTLLFIAAIAGVLLTGGTAASLKVYSLMLTKNISVAKSNYENLLNTNNDIREILAKGDRLAQGVLNRTALEAHPTSWGMFLQFLGTARPEGLLFERLGTDPVDKDASKMRVAITGSSSKETIVTDFVKTMSAFPLVSNVSLSSIDRIPQKESLCTFKIICTLSISTK